MCPLQLMMLWRVRMHGVWPWSKLVRPSAFPSKRQVNNLRIDTALEYTPKNMLDLLYDIINHLITLTKSFRTGVDNRFDGVNGRFDAMDGCPGSVDGCLRGFDGRIENMDNYLLLLGINH